MTYLIGSRIQPADAFRERNSTSPKARPLRVLAIAYACEPERGSEPGIGWAVVSNLSVDCVVDVFCEAQHRPAIEAYLARKRIPTLRFVFVGVPFWKPRDITRRSHLRLLDVLYYRAWEVAAVMAAWRACRRERFDIVHHITFSNVMVPPLAALLPGKFVWGPIGPVESIPWPFLRKERTLTIARELLRSFVLGTFLRVSPRGLLARARASALLFKTTSAAAMLRRSPARYDAVLCDPLERPITHVQAPADDNTVRPLRILIISRLQAHKGVAHAITALARFLQSGGQGSLIIIGDGPERGRLMEQAGRLGVQSRVEFRGHVAQAEVAEELARADVLLHPSFRDGLASAPLEALGASVPVICQRRSGMPDVIDETCGALVAAATPETLAQGFAEVLLMLYQHPRRRARLRRGAFAKRQELSTRDSIETLRATYRHLSADTAVQEGAEQS